MLRIVRASMFALLLTPATAVVAHAADCTIASKDKDDNAVVKACKEGGITAAKAKMKAMQKAAKEKGMKKECNDCHKDPDSGNWTLAKNADEEFKKMLALLK